MHIRVRATEPRGLDAYTARCFNEANVSDIEQAGVGYALDGKPHTSVEGFGYKHMAVLDVVDV